MLQNEAAGNEVVVDDYKLLPVYRKWGSISLYAAALPITARLGWFLMPGYMGIQQPMSWPIVVLGIWVMTVLMWRMARPGKAREDFNFIKVAACMNVVNLAMTLVMAFQYHVTMPKEARVSSIVARHISVHSNVAYDPIKERLSSIESFIEACCWIVCGASVLVIHMYVTGVIERRKKQGNRAAADATERPAEVAAAAPRPAIKAAKDSGSEEEEEDTGRGAAKGGRGGRPVRRKA